MNSPVTGTEVFWAMAAVIALLLIVAAKAISVANHHAGAARAAAVQAATVVAQAQPQSARRTGRGAQLLLAAGAAGAGLWLALSMSHTLAGGAQHPHARPTVASPTLRPAPTQSAPARPRTTVAPGSRSPLTGTEIVILVAIVSVTTIPIALTRRGRKG